MRTRESEQLKNADLHMILMRHGIPVQPLSAKAGLPSTALHEALMGSRLIGADAADRIQAVIEMEYPEAYPDFMVWRGVRGFIPINPSEVSDLESPMDDIAAASRLATDISEVWSDGTLTHEEFELLQRDFNRVCSRVAPQMDAWGRGVKR